MCAVCTVCSFCVFVTLYFPYAGDQLVIVRQNELLLGVIDKNSVGSQEYGLTHSVYELYGAQRAGALLSAIGRLLTIYLQMTAITCGMEDLVLKPAADSSRREMIAGAMEAGVQAAAKFAGVAVPEESKASENQEVLAA